MFAKTHLQPPEIQLLGAKEVEFFQCLHKCETCSQHPTKDTSSFVLSGFKFDIPLAMRFLQENGGRSEVDPGHVGNFYSVSSFDWETST